MLKYNLSMVGVLFNEQSCGSCVAILFRIHFTQLMGSCFVVGLLLFVIHEALLNVLSRSVV